MPQDDPEKITLYVYVTRPYANKVACFPGDEGVSYDIVHGDFNTPREIESTGPDHERMWHPRPLPPRALR